MNKPAIKWSGSKRSQAAEILTHFPKDIKTYYEPFCGGASVFRALMDSGINVEKCVLSDANGDLISLWREIRDNPLDVAEHYEMLWTELNRDEDLERKKAFFNEIRERFNKERNPLDFMFIMRTTTNGMPRYNANGEFNNSFHVTRNGIEPSKLYGILYEWSRLLEDVELENCSYTDIIPGKGDFTYMDPPYFNTKGMYHGRIDYERLWEYIRNLKCGWVLSFDGMSGDVDNTVDVPLECEHFYLKSGNSSFKRVIGKSRNSVVYESLYVKN